MTLLQLDRVSKRHPRGSADAGEPAPLLNEVSLDLEAGEVVGVWGRPGSGRTTLLRVAAGIEAPDDGVVRLSGLDLARTDRALDTRAAYCDPTAVTRGAHFFGSASGTVLEELVAAQLARGIAPGPARERAETALARTGAEGHSTSRASQLDGAAAVRVTLAHALTIQPPLLIIDEPTKYVDVLQRDSILALLRSLAEEGLAVLMSVGESTSFYRVDRALTLSAGRLRGKTIQELAPVVTLSRRRSA